MSRETIATEVHERIRFFLSLEPNWDSYGACRIDPQCASLALQVADELIRVAPEEVVESIEIFAGPDGGVQVELGDQQRTEVEVRVPHDRSFSVMILPPDQTKWECHKHPPETPISTITAQVLEVAA